MSFVKKHIARALDFGMCVMMNSVQFRHRLHANSRAELERYIAECEPLTREQFFAIPRDGVPSFKTFHPERSEGSLTISAFGGRRSSPPGGQNDRPTNTAARTPEIAGQALRLPSSEVNEALALQWQSPVQTPFAENNRAHAQLFPCAQGWSAPTVLMLHALMSASDVGYQLWAKRFNARGWNACFVHLPYHYSRRPPGYWNGELAISADLVRTAEGLRQGVTELRQLMQFLRARGSREFALWATSYGGWIGALLLFVEREFRFAALMAPIVNVDHAIWKSAAAVRMRAELRRSGITPALVERHFHLTSPMHGEPLCEKARVLFAAGDHDQVALAEDIARLHENWRGSGLLRVPQGHFGYRMMREVFARVDEQGWL